MLYFRSLVLFASVLALLTGCKKDDGLAQVSGKVTVDGQIPPAGSSITFFPVTGDGRVGGDTLENGEYSTAVPVGELRVEIRVPKPVPNPNASTAGPGAGDRIMESLPEKYNNKTELRITIVAGSNQKDWEVSTKP